MILYIYFQSTLLGVPAKGDCYFKTKEKFIMATRPHVEENFGGGVLTEQQRLELVSAQEELVAIETQADSVFADHAVVEAVPSIGTNLGAKLLQAPILSVRKNRKNRRAEQREQEETHAESGRVILVYRVGKNGVAGFILRDLQPGEQYPALVYFEDERLEKYPWCKCAKRGCVGVHRNTQVHFSPIFVAPIQGKRYAFSITGLNQKLYGANLYTKWVRPVTVFELAHKK